MADGRRLFTRDIARWKRMQREGNREMWEEGSEWEVEAPLGWL